MPIIYKIPTEPKKMPNIPGGTAIKKPALPATVQLTRFCLSNFVHRVIAKVIWERERERERERDRESERERGIESEKERERERESERERERESERKREIER